MVNLVSEKPRETSPVRDLEGVDDVAPIAHMGRPLLLCS